MKKQYIVTLTEEERRMLRETLLRLSSIRRTTLDTPLSPCITDTYAIRLRAGILPPSRAATARAIAAVVCPSFRAAITPPASNIRTILLDSPRLYVQGKGYPCHVQGSYHEEPEAASDDTGDDLSRGSGPREVRRPGRV